MPPGSLDGLGPIRLCVGDERRATQDESADLSLLARTRITVVCAGVKSILDVPATLQRLETRGVSVVGFRTDSFPGFYLHSSGQPIDWQAAALERAFAPVGRARVLSRFERWREAMAKRGAR